MLPHPSISSALLKRLVRRETKIGRYAVSPFGNPVSQSQHSGVHLAEGSTSYSQSQVVSLRHSRDSLGRNVEGRVYAETKRTSVSNLRDKRKGKSVQSNYCTRQFSDTRVSILDVRWILTECLPS